MAEDVSHYAHEETRNEMNARKKGKKGGNNKRGEKRRGGESERK